MPSVKTRNRGPKKESQRRERRARPALSRTIVRRTGRWEDGRSELRTAVSGGGAEVFKLPKLGRDPISRIRVVNQKHKSEYRVSRATGR